MDLLSAPSKNRSCALSRLPALLLVFLFLLGSCSEGFSATVHDTSWQKTFELYKEVPCLTSEELDYGREIITGLNYNSQRIFRRICQIPGIDFENSKIVAKKDGDIVKNEVLNPRTISDIARDFAKENYFKLAETKKVSQANGFKKYGDELINAKNTEEFMKIMADRGIAINTNEFL